MAFIDGLTNQVDNHDIHRHLRFDTDRTILTVYTCVGIGIFEGGSSSYSNLAGCALIVDRSCDGSFANGYGCSVVVATTFFSTITDLLATVEQDSKIIVGYSYTFL